MLYSTISLAKIEDLLQTYTLSEVIESNGLSEADVLYYLVSEEFLELPDPEPL